MNMTREVPLGKSGKVAIVDADDYEMITRWKWQYIKSGYANRVTNSGGRGKYINVLMHRVLAKATEDVHVDHINGNKLDNRKSNLRLVSRSLNSANRGISTRNTSGFKGVSWENRSKKWLALVIKDGKRYQVGKFDDVISAAKAYNKKALELFGHHAKLNDLKGL